MPVDPITNLIRNLRLANASLAQASHELSSLGHADLVKFVAKWQNDVQALLAAAITNDLKRHPPRGPKEPRGKTVPVTPTPPAHGVQHPATQPPAKPAGTPAKP